MAEQRLDVDIVAAAPIDAVWEVLADTARWPEWAPFDEARLERPGTTEAEGVGAIRAFRRKKTNTTEEVVGFEPPHRFAYELRSGLPIRDYHAEVHLSSTGSGTRIEWRSTFRAKYPGTGGSARRTLQKFVEETADALGAEAERRAGGS